ncbi:hypothetical protein L7F22_046251 [Adiantum nelumboides]|nr:hypothetical protein [Adiantum nelumboides]
MIFPSSVTHADIEQVFVLHEDISNSHPRVDWFLNSVDTGKQKEKEVINVPEHNKNIAEEKEKEVMESTSTDPIVSELQEEIGDNELMQKIEQILFEIWRQMWGNTLEDNSTLR